MVGLKFDILKDTACEIASGLHQMAWGGEDVRGLVDFPGSSVLSKCPSEAECPDVAIFPNPKHWRDLTTLSGVPVTAMAVNIEYSEPSDTTSPFNFPIPIECLTGSFGESLKYALELAAVQYSQGHPYEHILKLWGRLHGYSKWKDLEQLMPSCRSAGSMALAGADTVLQPACVALRNVVRILKVQERGTSRKSLGNKHAVDWPRLKALCQSVGASLLAEDVVFPHDNAEKKLLFRYVAREFPAEYHTSNYSVSFLLKKFKEWDCSLVNRFVQGILKSASVKHILEKNRAEQTLMLNEDVQLPPFRAVEKIHLKPTLPAPRKLAMRNDPYDLAVNEPRPDLTSIKEGAKKPHKLLHMATYPFVEKSIQYAPPPVDCAKAIFQLQMCDTNAPEASQLFDFINTHIPRNIFTHIRHFALMVESDHAAAFSKIRGVLSLLKYPSEHFNRAVVKDLWGIGMEHPYVRVKIAEAILSDIKYARMHNVDKWMASSTVRSLLSNAATVNIGLARVIQGRLTYWSRIYRARSLILVKEQRTKYLGVSLQLRAKLFQRVQFVVDEDVSVHYNNTSMNLKNTLKTALENHVNHIRAKMRNVKKVMKVLGATADRPEEEQKKHVEVTVVQPIENQTVLDYAKQVDSWYNKRYQKKRKLLIRYEEVVNRFEKSLNLVIDDVKRLLYSIAGAEAVSEGSIVGDLVTSDDEDDDIPDEELDRFSEESDDEGESDDVSTEELDIGVAAASRIEEDREKRFPKSKRKGRERAQKAQPEPVCALDIFGSMDISGNTPSVAAGKLSLEGELHELYTQRHVRLTREELAKWERKFDSTITFEELEDLTKQFNEYMHDRMTRFLAEKPIVGADLIQ